MTLRITDTEWKTALTICTPAQLQALDYWRHGYGYKRIGIILGIPRDTARTRIDAGRGRLNRALAHPTPNGTIHDSEAA